MHGRKLSDSRFVIVSNGFTDSPAQALEKFLNEKSAAGVTTVLHPLLSEEAGLAHRMRRFDHGKLVEERRWRLPFRPPLTYPLDLLVPRRFPPADAWFGFNNLACLRGLSGRIRGQVGEVVYWCIDFVPDRFGRSLATRAYDAVDSFVARRVDARFELSQAALDGRNERLGDGTKPLSPTKIVPMGAWLDRVPVTSPDAHGLRRVVYMGHLVPRQGVSTLIQAVGLLRGQGVDLTVEIVGRGPEEESLRTLAKEVGAEDTVFHGFVEDHRELETILGSSSIAAAPYSQDKTSFTRFADPGKLKSYLAAGLPIVMTDVPPNAQDLAKQGAALIVDDTPAALAHGLRQLIEDPIDWANRRQAALDAAKEFDYNEIFKEALGFVGFET